MFRCLQTGRIMSANQVRREKAHIRLPDGRMRVAWYPKDVAKWDAKLLELAMIERVAV